MAQEKASFYSLFQVHSDGSIEPIRAVRIGGVQFGPGVRFGKGVSFSGVDLAQYIGHDFSIEENGGVAVILGIYK